MLPKPRIIGLHIASEIGFMAFAIGLCIGTESLRAEQNAGAKPTERVSLYEIKEERRWAAGAVPEAKLNTFSVNMTVGTDIDYAGPRAMRLTRLDPVHDDLGTDMAKDVNSFSHERLKDWAEINQRVGTDQGWAAVFWLPLDAPRRSATKIENLAGEIELATFEVETWEKGNLIKSDGFVYERPEVPGFRIRIMVTKDKYGYDVHLTPEGEGAFIIEQTVTSGRREIRFDSLSGDGTKPRKRSVFRYDQLPSNATLKITIGRIIKVERRPFHIENVPLP
jgi:hypothetical protein